MTNILEKDGQPYFIPNGSAVPQLKQQGWVAPSPDAKAALAEVEEIAKEVEAVEVELEEIEAEAKEPDAEVEEESEEPETKTRRSKRKK